MIRPGWHELLSGAQTGATAALCRRLLSLAAPVYGAGVALRNLAFDRGWRRVHHAPVPVVSIGNLTTGGTGKTPLVAWTVDQLRQLGARPGILSRGYGRRGSEENDEALVLQRLCPGTLHVQQPDRVVGARVAAEQGCNLLVLDDGFQHRRLARDLDVVLIDAVQPWGYGALLPRGLLREPRSSLRRADVICLTRADLCDDTTRHMLEHEIRQYSTAPIAACAFTPLRLANAAGETAPLSHLESGRLGAVCGIGNPQAFRRTLTSLGHPVAEQAFRAYPDHHTYSDADRAKLADWAEANNLQLLVVTLKDLVKLPDARLGPAQVWGLEIGVTFLAGEPLLVDRLRGLAPRAV